MDDALVGILVMGVEFVFAYFFWADHRLVWAVFELAFFQAGLCDASWALQHLAELFTADIRGLAQHRSRFAGHDWRTGRYFVVGVVVLQTAQNASVGRRLLN